MSQNRCDGELDRTTAGAADTAVRITPACLSSAGRPRAALDVDHHRSHHIRRIRLRFYISAEIPVSCPGIQRTVTINYQLSILRFVWLMRSLLSLCMTLSH